MYVIEEKGKLCLWLWLWSLASGFVLVTLSVPIKYIYLYIYLLLFLLLLLSSSSRICNEWLRGGLMCINHTTIDVYIRNQRYIPLISHGYINN